MGVVTRNVKEIAAADRQALEHVIGTRLSEDDSVVIQVLSGNVAQAMQAPNVLLDSGPATLPDWCNVYEGLSDEEIDDIERSIIRSPGGRSF